MLEIKHNDRGAYYRGTYLEPVRKDFLSIINAAPDEVPALRQAIIDGRIDGSTYAGPCACLVGTIAKARGCRYDAIPKIHPNPERPTERFLFRVRPGDTPESTTSLAIVLSWIDEWSVLRSKGTEVMTAGIIIGAALLIAVAIAIWIATAPDEIRTEARHVNDLIRRIEEEHGDGVRLTVYRSDIDQNGYQDRQENETA